nr:transposon TX1 [Tanacetum cinerariifolium]
MAMWKGDRVILEGRSEVTKKRGGVEKINGLWDGNNMEVDNKEERDEGDSNSEGGEFSDEENDDGKKMGCDNGSEPVVDSGGQNIREDEASRVSRESKVGDTFIGENVSSKNLVAEESKRLRGKKRLMYACNTNKKNCFGPALETRIIEGIGLVSPLNDSLKERIKINLMTIKTFREGKRSQQVASAGVKFREEMNVEGDLECRREKREISPYSLVVSEGDRLRKKKKANEEEMFEGKVDEMNFNQWKLDEKKYSGKKKNDRRSITKAIKMARKIKVKGLGENRKGVSEEDEGNSSRCNLNIEQVKEIEEMIGVSWVRVVEEESGRSKLGMGKWRVGMMINSRNVMSPSTGMVDDVWVEILWGIKVMDSRNCRLMGIQEFRGFFNVWIDEPDFLRVVEGARMKEVKGFQPDCRFRDRLKKVKESLRVWSKDRFGGQKVKVENLRNEAMRWELEAKNRTLSNSEMSAWRRNKKCNLRELMVDGGVIRPVFCNNKVENISVEEAQLLEKGFTEKEIWEAICGCGGINPQGLIVLMMCHFIYFSGSFNPLNRAFMPKIGSFEEETDETTDLHQHFSRVCSQSLETASQDTRDAVTIHPTTTSQEITMALPRTNQPKI